jgi:hypothetical protein
MFRGDDDRLRHVLMDSFAAARDLGQPRVGSEHLLLALSRDGGPVGEMLRRHHASADELRVALRAAAPLGAGAAADRDLLDVLAVDLDGLLDTCSVAPLDRPIGRQPFLPLQSRQERQRCAHLEPPLGLDALAGYEAGLRLAIARRERWYRPEHLGQVLISLDPGIAWVFAFIGVDRERLFQDLAARFPPPTPRGAAHARRRFTSRSGSRAVIRRYENLVGRKALDAEAIFDLIGS